MFEVRNLSGKPLELGDPFRYFGGNISSTEKDYSFPV